MKLSLEYWTSRSQSSPPVGLSAHVQRNWDSACTLKSKEELLLRANGKRDQARLLASQATHSADWLFALPISAIGLRLSNEAVRVAVAIRLGAKVCETHECPCGAVVDTTGTHTRTLM